MDPQLIQVIEFLVRQQFYKPDDIIMDRTKDQRIHIKNSGQAIFDFISLLSADLSVILDGNHKTYLEKLNRKFKFDIEKVYQNFLKRISTLEPEDRAPHLVVTFLLGDLLGDIRDTVFKQYLQKIKNQVAERKAEKINFEEVIGKAYERNEPNIAIIYNLCFLKFIAEAVKSNNLQKLTESLLIEYTNQFIDNVMV